MHLDCHLKLLVGTAEVEPDVRPAIWGPIFPLLLGLLSENKTLFFEADVESIENRSVPIFKASQCSGWWKAVAHPDALPWKAPQIDFKHVTDSSIASTWRATCGVTPVAVPSLALFRIEPTSLSQQPRRTQGTAEGGGMKHSTCRYIGSIMTRMISPLPSTLWPS